MEPARELRAVGGVDNAVDQVARRDGFVRRHPQVAITSPRENGTRLHKAVWTDKESSCVVGRAEHEELRRLLDYLEARFDRGDLMERPR